MVLKPYLAEMRMSARLAKTFGLACLIGDYAIRALRVVFLLLLWRSLFQKGGANGMTLEQIAKERYVNKSTVQRTLKRAEETIRRFLRI